jgi:hypothetical protein
VRVRIAVMDGGSTDHTAHVLDEFRDRIDVQRSGPDAGQTVAVNEGVRELLAKYPEAPYVGWLNADDIMLEDGLQTLVAAMRAHPAWVAVSARGALVSEEGGVIGEIPTAPFSRERFAIACTIVQPATLIRRDAWETLGGLDERLHMCFDYDLWWRLSKLGEIGYMPGALVAGSRDHAATKTRVRRAEYFREGMQIVRDETGHVPWHWCISEAFEREAGWEVGCRPGWIGSVRAAHAAAHAYIRWNWAPWFP